MKRRPPPLSGWCATHQKMAHNGRKLAKQVRRRAHPSETGMREYPCDATAGWWHIGHVPQATAAGIKTAREVYHRRPA